MTTDPTVRKILDWAEESARAAKARGSEYPEAIERFLVFALEGMAAHGEDPEKWVFNEKNERGGYLRFIKAARNHGRG